MKSQTRLSQLSLSSATPSNIHPQDYAGAELAVTAIRKTTNLVGPPPSLDESRTRTIQPGPRAIFPVPAKRTTLADRPSLHPQDGAYRTQTVFATASPACTRSTRRSDPASKYYIGKLIEGPPKTHEFYTVDHVLPFGYWLDEKKWVPVVHSHYTNPSTVNIWMNEMPSAQRPDPFAAPHESFPYTPYHSRNQRHTTFPLGRSMSNHPETIRPPMAG